ncbi:MAG: extracellular solute-binding protein [Lachnospiraceae bacterium]|nr:extracellular solute-binding protein [Lachnospiraceae bacterium]
MHAKVFLKRVIVFVLILSMVLQSLAFADTADNTDSTVSSEDADVSEGDVSSGETDSDTDETGEDDSETEEPVDPSTCDLEYYQYILDYYNIDDSTLAYSEYNELYGSKGSSAEFVVSAYEAFLAANHYEGMEPTAVETDSLPKEVYGNNNPYGSYDEFETSLYLDESGFVDFKIEVPESGFYHIGLDYYNIESKNSNIKRAVFVDGKLPFSEFTSVELKRMWVNNPNNYTVDEDGNIKWNKDNQGNDLKASQVEVHDWQFTYLYDSQGYYTGELGVYLEAGEHIITLFSITEATVLYGFRFSHVESAPSYKEYLDSTSSLQNSASGEVITIQAENANLKSSQMLYPQQDQSSAAVRPYSAKLLLNNTIGGNSWRLVGDWLEWDFHVNESGYYNIELLCKQNFTKGIYVSRKIMIDGEVPFAEFNEYGFSYDSTWFYEPLGNEDGAYKIYLTEGDHKLRMSVVLGEFGDIVGKVSDVTDDLNKIYRDVICVTGVAPDVWRDYQIESSLPGLTAELQAAYDKLDLIIKEFEELVGSGSDKERALTTMHTQLEELIEDNEYFVKVVGDYRTNVRACGTWIADVIAQPLALDSIHIHSVDTEVEHTNNNFWVKFVHEMKRLFYSFIIDYDIVGDVSDPNSEHTELVLWVGTGRDQSNVIKNMISENFTSSNGINVTVMLVDINTLLQATLAGQGPDVAIEVNYDLPVNYGLRNAVYDLSNFDDLEEVLTRFDDSSYEAYQHGESTFALPCTQTFLVMFYRKDILKELNIEVPETWEEMITCLTVMSQNNMDLGMLPGEEVFLMFLLQNGGEYYNEEGSKTLLDSEEAINSFTQYCEWYTDYGVDKTTNVEQRFRTGEAPIIIYNFGFYNTLQVSAPDINGLWGVTQVPGTERIADETIYDSEGNIIANKGETYVDHTIASVGNACVIMSACEEQEAAWEFLKWWTSAETQVQYSQEMESINGSSAKVPTANIEAFQQIGYPVAFTQTINEQRNDVRGIRQVAGSYFTFRYINNAYYAVTADLDSSTPREELTDRITYINDEIEYKRHELGLD